MSKILKRVTLGLILLSFPALSSTLTKPEIELLKQAHIEPKTVSEVADKRYKRIEGRINNQSVSVYLDTENHYMIPGDLYFISQEGNLVTERTHRLMQSVKNEKLISYISPKQDHEVWVFADHSCGYCQKMHSQIDDYLELGISVHYILWPRDGLYGQNAGQLSNALCAESPVKSFTKLMAGVPTTRTANNCHVDIARQFQIGKEMGINGTPSVLTGDGHMIGGYLSPENLKIKLDN
ncbi:thiol:disulfide interchange protein DsbC [Vibrio xiamenensis]|uniref:Thiol:disulfide interchange protein n=1 Tax=Vibrio xiamenensis TaxID=861298 RepID=A0A1G8CK29_9VIBR|nr:thioredoxin fold domain-containing protein [Vibrio xiamenensis]SDH45699.1 thiol:disulfide interchange protein DsbC [Vibrio xiamenensis]